MKKLFTLLTLLLCVCIFAGCMGTPVIYHTDCDCPTEGTKPADPKPEAPTPEGALKTGLSLVTSIKKSESATAEKNGKADYDITMVAVLVDDNGVIQDCIIDSINTSIEFNGSGELATELGGAINTKNELGDSYSMPSGSWKKQAQALADYAKGKTVAELKNGAVDESGKAPAGSDLESSASIYLGGYVSAIELAAANASHLGAMGGDELRLACLPSNKSSKAGLAQLDVDVTALTLKDGKITSCAIDSVQAKVEFDTEGKINTEKTDVNAPVKTKNELGADYGMVAWSKPAAIAEWNEQAASFAEYVTGKTPAEVEGISVDAGTKPTDADLSSSVTIAIGGFKALIAKAAQ